MGLGFINPKPTIHIIHFLSCKFSIFAVAFCPIFCKFSFSSFSFSSFSFCSVAFCSVAFCSVAFCSVALNLNWYYTTMPHHSRKRCTHLNHNMAIVCAICLKTKRSIIINQAFVTFKVAHVFGESLMIVGKVSFSICVYGWSITQFFKKLLICHLQIWSNFTKFCKATCLKENTSVIVDGRVHRLKIPQSKTKQLFPHAFQPNRFIVS